MGSTLRSLAPSPARDLKAEAMVPCGEPRPVARLEAMGLVMEGTGYGENLLAFSRSEIRLEAWLL